MHVQIYSLKSSNRSSKGKSDILVERGKIRSLLNIFSAQVLPTVLKTLLNPQKLIQKTQKNELSFEFNSKLNSLLNQLNFVGQLNSTQPKKLNFFESINLIFNIITRINALILQPRIAFKLGEAINDYIFYIQDIFEV